MKAVIVELWGTMAAALGADGSVRKVKNRSYEVGQIIELKEQKHSVKVLTRIAAAAAVIAAVVIPSQAYYAPYSYVSLDVNPSIEYSLNRFDRVLTYAALNGDGADVLDQLSLKNKNIQKAIELTLKAFMDEGYLSAGEPGGIVIAASSKDASKSDELAETLADTVEAKAREEALEIEIEAEGVGRERVQQAKELGISPGKLNLIEKLQKSSAAGEDIRTQDWLYRSVKEIMEQTKENKKTEIRPPENSNADSGNKDNLPPLESNQGQNQAQGKGKYQRQKQSNKQLEQFTVTKKGNNARRATASG